MVRGLDLFRERFRNFEGAFILIGGAACDEWFSAQGLTFRATKDLDLVLIIEVVDASFVAALRAFIAEGNLARNSPGASGPIWLNSLGDSPKTPAIGLPFWTPSRPRSVAQFAPPHCDRPFKLTSVSLPLRWERRGDHETRRQGDP
jgi:hypothetical protein